MHHITEYITQSGNPMTSIFTANPFGFLMKVGESDENMASRQSTDSGSLERKTISDLQVRMIMWEFEAYLNGYHMKNTTSLRSIPDSSSECDSTDRVKPHQFKPFVSIVNSQKTNTFLKDHPGRRLKLEQLCGKLHYKNSKKVMTEFRDCVLRANPPMSSMKMAELFEIILNETLAEQREDDAAWWTDTENINKFSTEYIGKKISKAMESVSSMFTHTSNKIMPVVDFVLGTDDGDVNDDRQVETTYSAADSERAQGHECVIKRGAQELERLRGNRNHSQCTMSVKDETENETLGEPRSDDIPRICRLSKDPHHHPIKGGLGQEINRNTNNCTNPECEMNPSSEDVDLKQQDDRNLIDGDVKFRCKSGKIKRRIDEDTLNSEDIYIDVRL